MNALADSLTIVRADAVAPQPWKNGGGTTRELLRVPLPGGGADDWLLRISIADIEADGPFSPFPGVTRLFAVLEGAGVRLSWPGRRPDSVVTRLDPPLRFDGADAPGCALMAGRTRDLNVMLRQGTGQTVSLLAVAAGEQCRLDASVGFGLFTLHDACVHGPAATPLELPAFTLVWCAAPSSESPPWIVSSPAGIACNDEALAYRIVLAPTAPPPANA